MPFAEEFRDVYELGIKPACAEAGAVCERVDEQIFFESILGRIYRQIVRADVIVADMTGRNPNVFYEVGFAHALNKMVLLLTRTSEDIPFDLNHYPHIIYGRSITGLRDELRRRVQWCLSNSETAGIAIPALTSRLHGLDVTIENKNSGRVLTVDHAGADNGVPVHQWRNEGTDNQRWWLYQQPDGSFALFAKHSDKCLSVTNWSLDDFAPLVQSDWGNGLNQRWWLTSLDDGSFRILNVNSGKALDDGSWDQGDWAGLLQYYWHGGDIQRWMIKVAK